MLESKGRTGTIQTRSSHISEKIWQSIHPRRIRLWSKRTTERRPYRLWRGETQSGVSPSVGRACCSVAPWLRKFGSIHLRNVGTISCKNVETLPLKNNLSRFKSLLVTGLWDITLTYLLPPIQSCSCKFWAWSCIVSNFAKGWRGDHKHKIMDRPLIPKYGTVSQVLLQLVLVSVIWPSTKEFIAETTCLKRSHAFSTLIKQGLMGRLQKLRHVTSPFYSNKRSHLYQRLEFRNYLAFTTYT